MIKIRSDCFETNSSSTHCLVIRNDIDCIDPSEDVFTKQYIIKPFSGYIYEAVYQSIEDKLRYFLTLYFQGSDYHVEIMSKLEKMFPNALFIKTFGSNEEHYSPYVYEDAEYYQEAFHPTFDELKDFMLNGTVYFGDRDDDWFNNFTDHIKSESKFYCCWSG